ncbi:MAG: aminodeoxychorismate synthase component I [Candidatus Omnitrophota bacterium]
MTAYCSYKSYDFKGDAFDLAALFQDEPNLFFLDSSLVHNERGRYSFIGFDPFFKFLDKNRNSLPDLRRYFQQYAFSSKEKSLPLEAGCVGFLGYDFGFQLEDIKIRACDDLGLPDCFFGFYDTIITIDHLARKLHITSTGLPEKKIFLRQKKAEARIEALSNKLKKYSPQPFVPSYDDPASRKISAQGGPWTSNFSHSAYLQAVDKALDYIAQGEIYQVNLSQRFSLNKNDLLDNVKPLDIYRCLRAISPSCFGGYLDCGDFQIISSSPERFLCADNRKVSTRPMKGTRPRGQTFKEDEQLKKELLSSGKDKAELLMITDLLRNDLGRVCQYGTIRVRKRRALETYSTVFQTTSEIEGRLKDDKDIFDILAACFPGGSITGCPKIRAMEVIEELEPTRRGIYTGALGYMSFSGRMDFNILIRTLLSTREKLYFQVGGGIVADSLAQKEYEETLIKAEAIHRCLGRLCAKKVSVYSTSHNK